MKAGVDKNHAIHTRIIRCTTQSSGTIHSRQLERSQVSQTLRGNKWKQDHHDAHIQNGCSQCLQRGNDEVFSGKREVRGREDKEVMKAGEKKMGIRSESWAQKPKKERSSFTG